AAARLKRRWTNWKAAPQTQGLGLIRVASYLAQPYLQSGALVACLEQAASDLPLSLVYPQNRYLPPAVRAFYDWSRRVLQPPHSEA
ncbi:LysR substrate-binding domain-containing protein, partial [Klebsiella pneumoniae]